jgi:aminoacrylate hydrolase
MPSRAVNDIEMYYQEQGSGDPVMLIVGLNGVGASWGPQIPLFAGAFRTIVPDHRGTGKTSAPEGGYTIRQHASDMAQLLRALQATPAHIVGSSTGGAIGQVMALEHPDAVRSLTLVSTWGRTDNFFRRLFELRKRALQELGYGDALELGNLFLFSPGYLRDHWDDVLQMERNLKASPPSIPTALKRIDMILAHDALDRLKHLRQPTSIVVGELDMVTPVYFSEELKRHIPQAELHVIEGTGHFVFLEKAEAFFQTVRDFLRKAAGAMP